MKIDADEGNKGGHILLHRRKRRVGGRKQLHALKEITPSFRPLHGFTLVELLAVIAIIGTLAALLLPAVQAARESSRRVGCSNNLKQLGLAVLNFEHVEQRLPAAGDRVASTINNPLDGYSWIVKVLPFIEQRAMYDAIVASTDNLNTNIGPAIDAIATNVSLSQLICPSYRGGRFSGGRALTNYKAAAGVGRNAYNRPFSDRSRGGVLTIPFGPGGNSKTGISIGHIFDGTSMTFMIAETKDSTNTASWTGGVNCWLTARVNYTVLTRPMAWSGITSLGSSDFTGYGGPVHGVTSDHASGSVLHCFADGHVIVVAQDIDPDLFACLYSRAAREPIPGLP